MNGVKTKIRRAIYWLKHDFVSIENIVLALAIVMCLVWTYQSIGAMSRNWELVERLGSSKKSLELLQIEVETAGLENEYYETDEYKELAARKFAGKQEAGEHMVYLPENSEKAKNKHKITVAEEEEREYSNFEKWMMYLFPNS